MRRKSQRAGTKPNKSNSYLRTLKRLLGKKSSSPSSPSFIDLERGPTPRSPPRSPKQQSNKKRSPSPPFVDIEKGQYYKKGTSPIEIVIHK